MFISNQLEQSYPLPPTQNIVCAAPNKKCISLYLAKNAIACTFCFVYVLFVVITMSI